MTPDELIAATEAIYERYEYWWRNEGAIAELRALWGDAVNDCGVFINPEEETLHDEARHKASITLATANGVHSYECHFEASLEGFGHAPSVSQLFASREVALTAAIKSLLQRIPNGVGHMNDELFAVDPDPVALHEERRNEKEFLTARRPRATVARWTPNSISRFSPTSFSDAAG